MVIYHMVITFLTLNNFNSFTRFTQFHNTTAVDKNNIFIYI